jgi:DNA polymerase-3 subunit epsilon
MKPAAWVLGLYAAALLVAAAFVAALVPADPAAAVLGERAPLVVSLAALLLALCIFAVRWFFGEYVTAVRRLTDQVEVVVGANQDLKLETEGAGEVAELATAINRLADERRSLRRDVETRARESGARLEEERNRLAALMSELAEGVLVCNAEGRILLYNERARQLFSADEALLGLGRSLFGLIDRAQVAHARDKLQAGSALARFVTATPAGRLLKVQAAPVAGEGAIAGMVLTLEDVTGVLDREQQRLRLLHALTSSVRSPAANLRAAAENLASYPDMEAERRTRFIEIVAAESALLSRSIDEALRGYADAVKASLTLSDMRATELVGVARRRLETLPGLAVETDSVTDELWLRVDSFAMIQAFTFLCERLRAEYAVRRVRFAAQVKERFVELDLGWDGAIVASEALSLWETQPLGDGPLTLRDVLERHGAEVWIHEKTFRFLLPAGEPASAPKPPARAAESRPEYYDFDLFRYGDSARELHERRLADLAYTVFDTETTGLEPSAGDEIISIGAVRIVNARLLKNEVFERLVNPRRPLNRDSARVHGIDAAALAAEPGIEEVLPAFHRFCEDTVLVAHNAAFDMRFLELKEASTGVRFAQPVLDTLLLSALLHPSLDDHRLESMADRLGVQVIGRHTALGDALLEAEIFLRLLPLLAARGIVTLRQALDASRQTYYSRLRY